MMKIIIPTTTLITNILLLHLGSIPLTHAFTISNHFMTAFTTTTTTHNLKKKQNLMNLKGLISSGDVVTTAGEASDESLLSKSTLTLLEHINLNVPNHDYILDFYFNILGMGLDPRRAQNVVKGSGTVWANCGASQFHLPYGEMAQVIPGSIGLVYDDLTGLVNRLDSYQDVEDKPYSEYSIVDRDGDDSNGIIKSVRIVDRYGNEFYCRLRMNKSSNELINIAKQPIVYSDNEDHINEFDDIASKYGLKQGEETECKGISYVEFNVMKGKNIVENIAEFYDCVFDAPTNVVTDPRDGNKIAIIGFGDIDDDTGKASQSLLYREVYDTDDLDSIPKYDGHHIALYVGENFADFEKAFENIVEAGVLWVNPRFSDKATNLNTAKKWKQFRFKNILSLEFGKKIFELEHEVRSRDHEAWPGQ